MTGDQRFVFSVRIIGAVHRDTPKLKMFMISVLWSDEAEVIIYRSFQDFRKFHRQLKKRFPHTLGKDRLIPKFRARKSSLKQRGTLRAMQRMRFLESYCIELLKCEPSVIYSLELSQFFTPKENDLLPDFTKNSVMILLSDDQPDGPDGAGGPAGHITHPFVTQTYRCVAEFETKDTKNRPFKVGLDEKVDVLIKEPSGWWMVENEAKHMAWFPAPYLELWDEEEEDEDDNAGFQLGGSLYCAVRNYSTKKEDEVSVPIGAVVEVLRKSDNGWWLIRFNGKAGYVPSMYLKPYNNPRAGLFNLQRKLHSSTLSLASSREPQASPLPEINPEAEAADRRRGELVLPGRFRKAQSLDVLSESWAEPRSESGASSPDDGHMSDASQDASLSGFSSDSGSSSSVSGSSSRRPNERDDSSRGSLDLGLPDGRSSSISSGAESSMSIGSSGSGGAPRVPPRPKTHEILTRCTTMTRKAALASQSRLQPRVNPSQAR